MFVDVSVLREDPSLRLVHQLPVAPVEGDEHPLNAWNPGQLEGLLAGRTLRPDSCVGLHWSPSGQGGNPRRGPKLAASHGRSGSSAIV